MKPECLVIIVKKTPKKGLIINIEYGQKIVLEKQSVINKGIYKASIYDSMNEFQGELMVKPLIRK